MARRFLFAIGLLVLTAIAADAYYRPVWLMQEKFDYVFDVENQGLRTFPHRDTSKVFAYAVRVLEVMHVRDGAPDPSLAPGDSVLILGRGTWTKEDRERYLCFVKPETRVGYTGLPLPMYEGVTLPCDRFVPMLSRGRADCVSAREAEADSCACVRETVRRYADLAAAREAGNEEEFLRHSLNDENVYIVLSAMGIFRLQHHPTAMEWMVPLLEHPEYQVRHDLAEALPYMPGGASVAIAIRLLEDPDTQIQILAVHGLGRLEDRSVEPILADVLEDPTRDKLVRAMCISVLDGWSSPYLIPALETAIRNTEDPKSVEAYEIHLEKQKKKAGIEP